MTLRLQILLGAFVLSGCNCFVPVEECVGIRCSRLPDGGKRDGGLADGGKADAGPLLDAGTLADAGTISDAGTWSCASWDGGGVGKCAAITGYVASGTGCRGECVLYPIQTPGVFPTLSACVSCGCDTSKFTGVPMRGEPLSPNSFCDELRASTTNPQQLDEAFGWIGTGFDAGCVPVGAIDYQCTVWRSWLGDAGFARACAASLVPSVTQVRCLTWL